jgi:hypothetical protein
MQRADGCANGAPACDDADSAGSGWHPPCGRTKLPPQYQLLSVDECDDAAGPAANPSQATTGILGYFGKRPSIRERPHNRNSAPRLLAIVSA